MTIEVTQEELNLIITGLRVVSSDYATDEKPLPKYQILADRLEKAGK